MKRVVITGAGVVTPLGCDLSQVWSALCCGKSAVSPIISNSDVHLMAKVSRTPDFLKLFSDRGIRHPSSPTSDFIDFALLASDLALENAGSPLQPTDGASVCPPHRRGVSIGSGMGSLASIITSSRQFDESVKKLSPFFIPKVLINLAAGQISIRHKLQGPNNAVATACAAGAMSIGDAFNFMRLDYADMMVCGGVECSTDPLTRAGFARMKALSTSIDPLTGSRPFDKDRNGFVIGEGAGVLVLETLDSVIKSGREKRILAELSGYGVSGDASHITSPPPDGDGGRRAMISALRDANILCPTKIGYINAHATSTPAGDAAEVQAIEAVFGPSTQLRRADSPLYVSSTKGATGHLLGAAGAVEAIFSIMALTSNRVPPTANLRHPEPESVVFKHVVRESAATPDLQYAMSNSFGFGGVNASLIFKKYNNP